MSGLPTPSDQAPAAGSLEAGAPAARYLGPNGARRACPLAAPDPDALAAVPRPVAQRLQILPLERRGDLLAVAMTDPGDVHAIDELARHTGCRLTPAAAAPSEIHMA